jgi:hypothetical protein
MRSVMFDPACIYHVCAWAPPGPFWLPPPYLAGWPVNPAAVRTPEDGTDCRAWEPKE